MVRSYSKFPGETEPVGCTYMQKGIKSWLVWLWRLPRPEICRVSQHGGDPAEPTVSFSPKTGSLVTQEEQMLQFEYVNQTKGDLSVQNLQPGRIPFYLWGPGFSCHSYFQLIGWGSPSIGKIISFIQSIDLNAYLTQKHSHRNIFKHVFKQIYGHSVTKSSWHMKLTLTFRNSHFIRKHRLICLEIKPCCMQLTHK